MLLLAFNRVLSGLKRRWAWVAVLCLLAAAGCQGLRPGGAEAFSFGALADVQYCDCPAKGSRYYRESPARLQACVETLNQQDLAFVVELGDLIDRDWTSYEPVLQYWKALRAPRWSVLGNHEFSVADDEKEKVLEILGLSRRYYDFSPRPGWRCVVLDGNDMSLYAYAKDSVRTRESQQWYDQLKATGTPQAQSYNGGVGPEQMFWLRQTLDKADRSGEKVILFCHFPVYPPAAHNLWNAEEVVAVLEKHPAVAAYLNGHNHAGGYAEKNGIHYLNLQGMVETPDQSSFAIVTVHPDYLDVKGFGREPSRRLPIPGN